MHGTVQYNYIVHVEYRRDTALQPPYEILSELKLNDKQVNIYLLTLLLGY